MSTSGHNVAVFLGLVCLSIPSIASAESPTFDDGYVVINLQNEVHSRSGKKPSKVEYSPAMRLRVFGAERGDALKVRWRKGRKTLVERRCVLQVRDGAGSVSLGDRCWTRDAKITAHGKLTVQVYFVDDSEEKKTLLRTMKVTVGRYWRVDRVLKGRAVHSPRYQVVGSDLMGLAYAWLKRPSKIEPRGDVYFYFWSSLANDRNTFTEPSWRCKLNGKSVAKMSVDGHQAIESIARIKQQDDQQRGRKRVSSWYGWRLMWIKPKLIWGKKRNPGVSSNISNSRYNISTNPGSYVCRLRDKGTTVREFAFVVKPDGTLARHGAQGPKGVTLRPGAFFVSMKVVKNKGEHSFDAKAAKRSVAFGRPWPKTSDVRALHKSFPKTYGRAVPKKPRGVRR